MLKPNSKSETYGKIKKISAIEPPLWLLLLANYYHTNLLLDAEAEDLSLYETLEKIKHINPETIVILATGNHPSAYIQQQQIAKKIELLLKTHNNFEIISYTCLPFSLIKWGSPNWDLINLNNYKAHNWHSWSNNSNTKPYGVIYTSIGCPFKCSFCCIKDFYGTVFEQRPLEDVANDLKDLANRNIKNIKIMDELFIFNPNRVHLICDDIISNGYDFNIWAYARIDIMNPSLLKKMRKAGIKWLAYGIESGDETIRKTVIKGNFTNQKIKEIIQMTKDNDINIIGNFMFGFWDDTLDTMKETLDFSKELNCEYINYYCLVAYPGSQLYNEMKEKNVKLPIEWSQYAQISPNFLPLPTKTVNAKNVLTYRDKAFIDYFSNPLYLNYIEKKFGNKIIEEIKHMLSIKLDRNK